MGISLLCSGVPFIKKDALTLLEMTPDFSDSWIDICKRDKRMLEITEGFLQQSVWVGFIGVCSLFIIRVAQNHGVKVPFFNKEEKKQEEPDKSPEMTEQERASLIMTQLMVRSNLREAELEGANT